MAAGSWAMPAKLPEPLVGTDAQPGPDGWVEASEPEAAVVVVSFLAVL